MNFSHVGQGLLHVKSQAHLHHRPDDQTIISLTFPPTRHLPEQATRTIIAEKNKINVLDSDGRQQ